jgi:hypothetical protein
MPDFAPGDTGTLFSPSGIAVTVVYADNSRQRSWVTQDSDAQNVLVNNADIFPNALDYVVGDLVYIIANGNVTHYTVLYFDETLPYAWIHVVYTFGSGNPFYRFTADLKHA